MAAMMGDVMRAMKQLPCVSIAAIDGALLINIAHICPLHLLTPRNVEMIYNYSLFRSFASRLHLTQPF